MIVPTQRPAFSEPVSYDFVSEKMINTQLFKDTASKYPGDWTMIQQQISSYEEEMEKLK